MVNRNLSSIAKASHLIKSEVDGERKRNTRTKIQAGGLLILSGLFEQCNLSEGDDLQYDLEGREKAATLLGILIDASETLLQNNNTQQIEKFRKLGEAKLKRAASKYS